MSLNFLVKKEDGDLTIPLRNGLIIGRASVDLRLNDPTISSKHAEVRHEQDGRWILYDLGSRNGINYEGKKIQSLKLSSGVKFSIGRVNFETIEVEDTVAAAPPVKSAEVPLADGGWKEKLTRMSQGVIKSVTATARKVTPLNPPVRLSIVSGIQCNTSWTVGYGPRPFGSEQPEFPILEFGAPATCFSLSQGPSGVIFSTDHPDKVLLNGKPTKSDVIRLGDEITIAQTRIVVETA